ncbi:uncharacterized protein LOC119356727 isoform X1 [Triticum dicoccoides]|uniref:uncharacterized protein LOC119356727 isoform X1 n=2 Tax=Triticum dicoccoides TaxID=85692 RepID=UPI00188EE775|nr:uncharacterized protein LOC119356727 isoform X1 [Triticum dicoccoides]
MWVVRAKLTTGELVRLAVAESTHALARRISAVHSTPTRFSSIPRPCSKPPHKTARTYGRRHPLTGLAPETTAASPSTSSCRRAHGRLPAPEGAPEPRTNGKRCRRSRCPVRHYISCGSRTSKETAGGMAMAVAEARLRQDKVKKFEDFVDRRLKPDLVNAIAQRDNLFQQQKTFLDLKKNIENLEKNGVTSMRSMVNLGSEVYMQAEVPDKRHIFVDIGLGFHVEFTWQEALQFISVREARLARQIDEYTHLIASIKAQIKMVCEGIRELLQLAAE